MSDISKKEQFTAAKIEFSTAIRELLQRLKSAKEITTRVDEINENKKENKTK